MSDCDHNYQYSGVRYVVADDPLPGSGARAVRYYHEYFCTRCLSTKHKSMPSNGDNSYGKPSFNATPINKRDIKETT